MTYIYWNTLDKHTVLILDDEAILEMSENVFKNGQKLYCQMQNSSWEWK